MILNLFKEAEERRQRAAFLRRQLREAQTALDGFKGADPIITSAAHRRVRQLQRQLEVAEYAE